MTNIIQSIYNPWPLILWKIDERLVFVVWLFNGESDHKEEEEKNELNGPPCSLIATTPLNKQFKNCLPPSLIF